MNENEKQDKKIEELERENKQLLIKRARMCVKMEGVEKAISKLDNTMSQFGKRITDLINSFNQDKQYTKTFIEENYVSKKEFKFFQYVKDKSTVIGFIVGIGILTLFGAVGVYTIKFVDKLLK